MDMSENNEGEEIIRKENEWEVVALTESVYAAAPGLKQDILDNSYSKLVGNDKAETAHAMLMSGHFGFSPSTHENLQLDPEYREKRHGEISDHDFSQVTMQQVAKPDSKHEESLHIEGLISNEFPGGPQFQEKGDSMAFSSSDFEDDEREESLHSTQKVCSYDDEADEGTGIGEPFESVDPAVNPGISNVQKHTEEDKRSDLPGLPYEVWLRKNAASLYGHVKNANPFWSIFVAAAVMGLVIIGHRWQRDKTQVFQLKSQLAIDNEGCGWILHPISRLKDLTVGGEHGPYIRVSSSTEI